MIVLRCTQRLLKTSSYPISADPPAPTAPLGEWFANAVPLPMPGRWVVMYTNSQTLLTVVVPGRALSTTLAAFRERAPALLRRLGLPQDWIELQSTSMQDVVIARTNDRRVLGSMNDLAFQIQVTAEHTRSFEHIDWERLELDLAKVPLSMLKYEYPHVLAQRIAQSQP
jgi:hypothetical protein